MLGSRMHGPQWLTLSAHFFILLITAKLETLAAWPYALLAMALVSFFGWIGNYRRYRQIHDLPTAKVASAAQGYVELVGRSAQIDGEPLLSPRGRLPCCWYRYRIEEEKGGEWTTVDEGTSVAHFLLIDETGPCVISPDGAEVVTSHHRSWKEGLKRYNEWLLPPHVVIYALGEFTTHNGHTGSAADEREDVAILLANWKEDKVALHQRFDLNQDGTIDLKEWELARLQARREVRQQHANHAQKQIEGMHLLRKPRDGRLFLLANEMPETLGKRYYWWSLLHMLIFLGAGVGGLILLSFGFK